MQILFKYRNTVATCFLLVEVLNSYCGNNYRLLHIVHFLMDSKVLCLQTEVLGEAEYYAHCPKDEEQKYHITVVHIFSNSVF